MDKIKSKVYALIDEQGRITRIEGSYTLPDDLTGWEYIDEGVGDRYNLAQVHYLPKPLTDDRGVYRYKYIDGEIVERTQAEIDADYVSPAEQPRDGERITQLERAMDILLSGVTE